MCSWGWAWKPYVPVARKKREAEGHIARLKKKGEPIAPVTISGRKIARSFWGAAWCENLERYSDYASRLPRGRSYVRNGAVIDLRIGKGQVTAQVSGSELYTVKIGIEPVAPKRWQAICKDCAGAIDSLVELLQGRLAQGVMDRVCRQADGLFPAPGEIRLSCSCPDWADMCKHVAAALYGVGARLDEKPRLLFELRGVDETDLMAHAGAALTAPQDATQTPGVLAGGDMAALFGLDMADAPTNAKPPAAAKKKKTAPPRKARKPVVQKTAAAGPPRKTRAAKTAKASAPAQAPKPRSPAKKAAVKKAAARPKSLAKAPAKPAPAKKSKERKNSSVSHA